MSQTNLPASPVVVVGMHRSGTSLVASILGSAGVHLGDRLAPAAHGNPEGHFEDVEFVFFHQAALQAQRLHPDGWDEVVISDVPDALDARARALIRARSARVLWGWKDPRTTLFLPYWERLLPDAKFVFVYRNPWEVIDSLYRRGDDRFQEEPEAAARMWVHYNKAILDSLSRVGRRGLLFNLDDIIAEPDAFVGQVGEAFELDLKPAADLFKPDLLRRGRVLDDWRQITEAALPGEMDLLRGLDEATHHLCGRAATSKSLVPARPPAKALLRQWAALRRSEHERDGLWAFRNGPARDGHLQLFMPSRGTYLESESVIDLLPGDGRIRDYTFVGHYDASAPLRLDTGESVGLVEIEGITVRAMETGLALSWEGRSLASAPLQFTNVVQVGRSDHEGLCLLSLNDDPQVRLDLPEAQRFCGGCQIEIRVGFLPVTSEPIQRGVSALHRELDATTAASSRQLATLRRSEATVEELRRSATDATNRWQESAEALKRSEATVQELRRSATDATNRWQESAEALKRSEATVEELSGRFKDAANRWQDASRALRVARRRIASREGELAEEAGYREQATHLGVEVQNLRQALGRSEERVGELVRALEALRRSRAYRLARLGLDPIQRAHSGAAGLWRRLRASKALPSSGLQQLAATPLFDADFYLASNPDVRAAGLDPRRHYLVQGAIDGRDPSPWFATTFYLSTYPDVAASRLNPLVHYLLHGAREGRAPNPWFEPAFYVAANPEVASSGMSPLEHFVRKGLAEGRAPNAAFDPALYLARNPDVAASGADALHHYVTTGYREGRSMGTPASSGDYAEMRREIAAQLSKAIETVAPERPMLLSYPEEAWPLAAESIVFQPAEEPEVSVIIPASNKAGYTLECLSSLSRDSSEIPFEVILFDNASTDATQRLFAEVPNLRYVRSEENVEFVFACNRAAELARGEFAVFLNNDTQVTPGWLRELVETFEEDGGVGAAGPKILFPDGRLQEAGGHVTRDGCSEPVGVFDDPDKPRYNLPREVAYCSGVCLMVRTALFRELGGFDLDLAPEGGEDVDLCLRVRAAGRRVLYNPASVVVHHGGATASSLDDNFKLRCVARHQQHLVEKHHTLLDELNRVRLIAFYLPQFHPIPENDRWWGTGFTEWRNVVRARPNFDGHDQPRLPADLGFYDLRLPEVMNAQTALARRYGLYGFCYYYYWFAGKRLLETPLEMRLRDRENDFPFCVAWANENWTRTWDGMDKHILIGQRHSEEDDEAVIRDLLRYVEHPAYIRVNGRPLVLVYRAALFPDIRRTTGLWRDVSKKAGVGELYLAMAETFEQAIDMDDPTLMGFDASVEFPPHETGYPIPPLGPVTNPRFRGRVHDYRKVVLRYLAREQPGHRRFRTVMTGWDNTPRRQNEPEVFAYASPGAYRAWLEAIIRDTLHQSFGEERLVFINAWNEWAEGAYLEPDMSNGHGYLEATRDALESGPKPPA